MFQILVPAAVDCETALPIDLSAAEDLKGTSPSSPGARPLAAPRRTLQGPSPGTPHDHAPHGRPIPLRSGLRYDQLLAYVEARPSLSILEIGVARAANALRLLAFADALGGAPHYCGIDLFGQLTPEQLNVSYCHDAKRPGTLAETRQWLEQMLGPAIAKRIKLLEGWSHEVLPVLRQRAALFDLIFVDGGHDYDAVSSDWEHCRHLVAPGGVVVFDDFPNWGVAGAIAEIDRGDWNVQILDQVDLFENHRRDENPARRRMHLLVEVSRRGEA